MTGLGIHERCTVKKTVDIFSPILQLYISVCVQEKAGKLNMLLNETRKIAFCKYSFVICRLTPPVTGLYFAWFTRIAEATILCVCYVAESFKGA